MKHTDVVIIGGGPVGCVLGILLIDAGVDVVLIERDEKPYQLPRAIVMDDEIYRTLSDHGLGKWLEANTSTLERGDFVDAEGNEILGADIPPRGLLGVPPVVVHYQPDLDVMLREEFEARGGHARWGMTIKDAVDHGDKVVAVCSDGETIESRWLVGCDGASSWTRKNFGLTLEDLQFDQEWLVVDLELKDTAKVELPLGVRQYCKPDRPCTYVKGARNYRRWEFQVQEHESADLLNTTDGLWSLLADWIAPSDAEIVRSAVYRFHAVVAPSMQKGNVFLAGDSAHQMPPFAGQGLNSGMRDAVNLAWKLGFVKNGWLPESVLGTYTTERVPHVRSSVAAAVDLGRLIDQLAGRVSHGVGLESGYGGARPAPFLESGLVVAGDPRVGHQFWAQPEVSRMAVSDGGSFVVVSGAAVELPEELRRIRAKSLVDPSACTDAFAILVRPDLYVAAVASDADDLKRCASALFA